MVKPAVAVAWIGMAGVVAAALVTTGLPLLMGKKAHPPPASTGSTTGTVVATNGSSRAIPPSDTTTAGGSTSGPSTGAQTTGASPPAPAQTDTTYVGVVVNATDQQPISDASVALVGAGGDAVATNPSGCFTLTFGQLKGASTLFVSATGFRARSFEVDLSGDASKDAEVELQPASAPDNAPTPKKPMTLKLSPEMRKLMLKGEHPVVAPTEALIDKKSWLRPAKQASP